MSWSKHAKKSTGLGDYKLEKDDYLSPAEVLEKYGETVKIVGAYINTKSKIGDHPVVFIETKDGIKGLDLSPRYTPQWVEILEDEEDRQTIISGGASGTLVKKFSETWKKEYVAFNI